MQDYYNQYRSHGALQGRTPWQAWLEKLAVTPFHEEVEANFSTLQQSGFVTPTIEWICSWHKTNLGRSVVSSVALPPTPRDLAPSGQNGWPNTGANRQGPPPANPALSRRSSCVSAALYPPLRSQQSSPKVGERKSGNDICVPHTSSYPSAHHEMQDQGNYREDQQQVD